VQGKKKENKERIELERKTREIEEGVPVEKEGVSSGNILGAYEDDEDILFK
jgi:hypothetical protein